MELAETQGCVCGRASGVATKRRGLGGLESEILAALWAAESPLSVGGVADSLRPSPAYNTVQTILIRLHEKNLVHRRKAGRGHLYWPVEDAATAAATRMRAALAALPDRQAVLQQFAAGLDPADAATLRGLLS